MSVSVYDDLLVTYVGGSWDGLTYRTDDDQVPAVVANSRWEHYRLTDRVYDDGLLIEATYRHVPEMDS